MKVLQITANFTPNIGGVETHLSDLVASLLKRKWSVFVLSYRPLSTTANWKLFKKNENFTVLRIPWVRGFFEKLVPYPILEFIYLVPGLFIVTPFVIFFSKPDLIHAHGLIAVVSALFWGKLFNKRVILSLHNIYSFPTEGLYHDFVKMLLSKCDFVLSLSKKSYEEIINLGLNQDKAGIFTYWIDLERFVKIPHAKEKLGLNYSFIVLFVGRLIVEKGVKELIRSVPSWNKNIHLVVVGTGPLEEEVKKTSLHMKNIHFLGAVEQNRLPLIYSSADLLIFPSVSEEGFGRVIIESLACSTPVLASDRGAISEAMDDTVGKLIPITPENIKKWVEYFYHHRKKLNNLAKNARRFTERRYSEKNAEQILQTYKS